MSVAVRLPGALSEIAGGETRLVATGATLAEVIADIDRRYPGFAARILDEHGEVRPYVNIYVGESEVRGNGGTAVATPDGVEVMVIPAMAGGG